jgi:hypothetical protein
MTVPPTMATSRRLAQPAGSGSQWKGNLILFRTTVQPQSQQCLRRRTAPTRTLFGPDVVNLCGARPALPKVSRRGMYLCWPCSILRCNSRRFPK